MLTEPEKWTGKQLWVVLITAYIACTTRYQQYVGHVTWMRFEQIPGSRRKVLVANRNTVAALAASSGALSGYIRHLHPHLHFSSIHDME